MSASPATESAAALLDELAALGVRHVVVSPGSRSQALALAAAAAERTDRIRLHVRIDERVAGFTALGIGRETGLPAAVICTSGTAVAHLLPAVMEAHHSGVPLLLLTADRPPELRGIGANQATDQPGIFGSFTRFAADAPVPAGGETDAIRPLAREAFAAATGRVPGPAHLNLPFREPLAGELPAWFAAGETRAGHIAGQAPAAEARALARGPRTVVIAGADAGPAAEELAHEGSWPLIAEIVSGARFGRKVIHGYRALLRDPDLGGQIERAVVFGHPTLSREVAALLSRADVEVIAVRGPGEDLNLNHATAHVDAVSVARGDADRAWLGAWLQASAAQVVDLDAPAPDLEGLTSKDPLARAAANRIELAAVRREVDRTQLAAAVWAATWPHDRLMFGSSRIVRVADAVLPGKRVPVHANRGLAGIDGTIATGLGIALASQDGGRPGVTRVLLGDLALLHDAGALLLPASEDDPRIQIIVGNDGGGTIFDGLEVSRTAAPDAIDRVMFTPQRVDLAALARAYGWTHLRAATHGELEAALTTASEAPLLIEVPLVR